jgi:lipoprotein signal peptidase
MCRGIADNLVDRETKRHVFDFLNFPFWGCFYPTFNVADSAICVGVTLYALHSMRTPKPSVCGSEAVIRMEATAVQLVLPRIECKFPF